MNSNTIYGKMYSNNLLYNSPWQFIARSVGTRFSASEEGEVEGSTPRPETAQETESPQSSLVVSGKKRGKKKGRLVSVEEIMPKPSYWPLALAVSFIVLLMGIMISWIVIVVGAVLVIVSVMGWALERR